MPVSSGDGPADCADCKSPPCIRPGNEPVHQTDLSEQSSSESTRNALLGSLERLPADLLSSHIWDQLPRGDRGRLRLAGRGMAQYTASELMTHLRVRVCRASLLQLTNSGRTLHHRFPRPASLELRLQPPARRGQGPEMVGGGGDSGGGGAWNGADEGAWYGSTAVMSYFLSELGVASSVTSLLLQGWQELSPRDLHHVAASYPRLVRLHLGGLPYNNYLSGPSLEALTRGSHPCLREVVVDTQLLMDPQSALAALARLPRLASLDLTGVPLLPSLELPALGLLTRLTRLTLTFEHKHAHSEQQLAGLGALTGLRHLALDFMQLGTGSSLWSAGWLLTQVLSRLTALTALHLPRAFVDCTAHPAFLSSLAVLSGLVDLAMGSIILGSETAAMSVAAAAAAATTPPARATLVPVQAPLPPMPGDGGGAAPSGGDGGSGSPRGGEDLAALARPWRRLALGAAMPCYVESLLPLLLLRRRGAGGGGHHAPALASQPPDQHTTTDADTAPDAASDAGRHASAKEMSAAAAATATPSTPRTPALRARCGAAAAAGLELLELATPCPLQMLQLLPSVVVRHRGASCTAPSPVVGTSGGDGGGGGSGGVVREVRLVVRVAANWPEVVAAAAAVGPALTSLALLPTYLYGSGRMLVAQVVSAVASALPHLEHLELHRLNTDPWDISCLAGMRRLRFVLVGVAEEARERRGEGYPSSLVRALLTAVYEAKTRSSSRSSSGGSGCTGALRTSCSIVEAAAGESGDGPGPEDRSSGLSGSSSISGSTSSSSSSSSRRQELVVCCPDLSEEEAARLQEMCELEYGTYDVYGSRFRVERALDATLPSRLAVGCSLAPPRWRP